MMTIDTTLGTARYWAILLLVLSFSSTADSYLCEAERASGFVYNKDKNIWEAANFPVEDKRYLVSRTKADDIFSKALSYDYSVEEPVSTEPIIHCRAVKQVDSNEETGLVLCRGPYGASFNLDTRNGKYIRSQPTGYVANSVSSNSENLPYIEIGNCSPK